MHGRAGSVLGHGQEDRGDDMGQLYQLQGTSEPFATHLWNFWISERGPGYLEGKVLKVSGCEVRTEIAETNRKVLGV